MGSKEKKDKKFLKQTTLDRFSISSFQNAGGNSISKQFSNTNMKRKLVSEDECMVEISDNVKQSTLKKCTLTKSTFDDLNSRSNLVQSRKFQKDVIDKPFSSSERHFPNSFSKNELTVETNSYVLNNESKHESKIELKIELKNGMNDAKLHPDFLLRPHPFFNHPNLSKNANFNVSENMSSDSTPSFQKRNAQNVNSNKESSSNCIQTEENSKSFSFKPLNTVPSIEGKKEKPTPNSLYKERSRFIVTVIKESEYMDSYNQTQIQIELILKEKTSNQCFFVFLRDYWMDTVIQNHDIVNIIGNFDDNNECIIDYNHNFIILHPDILISSSSICTSFHCPRKAVLNERFLSSSPFISSSPSLSSLSSSSSSSSFMQSSRLFLMGNLRHRLFQSSMNAKNADDYYLSSIITSLIHSHLEAIHDAGEEEAHVHEELMKTIPKVQSWMKQYMLKDDSSEATIVNFGKEGGNHEVMIEDVIDIEDVVWSPTYGLKGVIDATVRTFVKKTQQYTTHSQFRSIHSHKHSHLNKTKPYSSLSSPLPSEMIIPFELKTGERLNGYAMNDHRAQVMLYTLLCNERYEKVGSVGLLHHLHTGSTSAVASSHNDLVGIMMKRNEHASNLLKASKTSKTCSSLPTHLSSSSSTLHPSSSSPATHPASASSYPPPPSSPSLSLSLSFRDHSLPEMIKKTNSCQKCSQLNNCLINHKAWENGNAESSGLVDIFDTWTNHLTENRINFLKKWERLIDLENDCNGDMENAYVHLWEEDSKEREKNELCMGRLKMINKKEYSFINGSYDGTFVYEFVKVDDDDNDDDMKCNNNENNRHHYNGKNDYNYDNENEDTDNDYKDGYNAYDNDNQDNDTDNYNYNDNNDNDYKDGYNAYDNDNNDNNDNNIFDVGDKIILSREDYKPMICRGRVEFIYKNKKIKISVNKKINSQLIKYHSNENKMKKHENKNEKNVYNFPLWRIDKDTMHQFSNLLRSNLYQLFYPKSVNDDNDVQNNYNNYNSSKNDDDNDDDGNGDDDDDDDDGDGDGDDDDGDGDDVSDLCAAIVDLKPPVLKSQTNQKSQTGQNSQTYQIDRTDQTHPSIHPCQTRQKCQTISEGQTSQTGQAGQAGQSLTKDLNSDLTVSVNYVNSLTELNAEQKYSIITSLSSTPYSLISGVPGSGKSTTIAHLINAYALMNLTILFTAYTHSAVDNVLLKLASMSTHFMRIGNSEKIHPDLVPHSFEFKLKNVNSVNEITELKAQVRIVAVTSLSISNSFFQDRKFDVCIVDEASQMTLPVCLGPILLSKRFVLVGDGKQLPPLVKSKEAKEEGMDVSLFHHLSSSHPSVVCSLNRQYRMCDDIMSLSNMLIYDHSLVCGSKALANSHLFLPNLSQLWKDGLSPWVLDVLDPRKPVLFIDTDQTPAKETRFGDKIFNTAEVRLALLIVRGLVIAGLGISEIGLVSPYLAQVLKLKSMASEFKLSHSLEIDTVDRWQGREKDCCVVSFVRSVKENVKFTSHLSDLKRLNVAITRSRKKLILIGSFNTLKCFYGTNKLVEILFDKGWVYMLPASALENL